MHEVYNQIENLTAYIVKSSEEGGGQCKFNR